jgi:chromosome segregation ATPase
VSTHTSHKHLGFSILFEELEPTGTLAMRESTWTALKATQDKVDAGFSQLRAETKTLRAEIETANTGISEANILIATLKTAEEQSTLALSNLRSTNEELATQLADAQQEIAALKASPATKDEQPPQEKPE